MRQYSIADEEVYMVLDRALNSSRLEDLRTYKIKFSIIFVTNQDAKSGETFPAFNGLPYRVKINNARDRVLRRKDVDIIIDQEFWDGYSPQGQEVLIISALFQLEVVEKKGFPVFRDDGSVKLRLKRPDMVFIGFSALAEYFGKDSVERFLWNDFLRNFEMSFRG